MPDEDELENPRVGIILGSSTKKRLKRIAKLEERTLSGLIRTLIAEALEARKLK